MGAPLLQVTNLHTYFRSSGAILRAVDGVDLVVNRGETLSVVGESGCGNSVTALSIMRLVPQPPGEIREGEIMLGDENLLSKSETEMQAIRGNEISMIFQEPMTSLNPQHTIEQQIGETLHLHKGLRGEAARARIIELLTQVGILEPETRMRSYPHQLSGGQRQRVMIAMAPTTALDVTIQAQILDLIRELQAKTGMAVVLITHDLGIVASLCQRLMVMYGGLILETGSVEDIFYRSMHPYTRALLRSVPSVDSGGDERLTPIDGQAPSLIDPPKGCPFAPRCPIREPACEAAIPEFIEYGEDRRARCPVAAREARA